MLELFQTKEREVSTLKTKKDAFDFEKMVLENGTEIFYQKTPNQKTELRLLLKAGGARYDPVGKEGCAHMLEHLIAKKTYSFKDEVEASDYTLEHNLRWNCYTNLENIKLEGRSNNIKEVDSLFFLLGEFLTKCQLKGKLLEIEKIIVAREMKVEQRDKNLAQVTLEANKSLFGEHTFWRIIRPSGTLWSVNCLTVKDIKKHQRKFFLANNLTIVIITSLSKREIKEKVKKYLTLPSGKNFVYPQPLKDFPKPARTFYSHSISKITNSSKLEALEEGVGFTVIIPSSEAIDGWEVIAPTLKEILLRKLRYNKIPLIYSPSVSGTKWRDISCLKIWTKVPPGEGSKTRGLINEGISQFQQEKRLFELFKKRRIEDIEDYQASASDSEIADDTIGDIAKYDKVITNQEKKEKLENFSFPEAVKWLNHWFEKERILVQIITP